jgi:hypothetical protein
MTGLTSLDLSRTDITDNGLQHIQGKKRGGERKRREDEE